MIQDCHPSLFAVVSRAHESRFINQCNVLEIPRLWPTAAGSLVGSHILKYDDDQGKISFENFPAGVLSSNCFPSKYPQSSDFHCPDE